MIEKVKKSKGLTINHKGEEVSFHKLVIQTNSKWKENIGLAALERFLKKQGKLKTSELNSIFVHFSVNPDELTYDIIKTVFKVNRLVTTKGKDKKTFSAFSWLKDLREYCENNDLKGLFDAKKDVLTVQVKNRIETAKKAA